MGVEHDVRMLVTGSTDGSVRSWDLKLGTAIRVFDAHAAPVVCMTVRRFLVCDK